MLIVVVARRSHHDRFVQTGDHRDDDTRDVIEWAGFGARPHRPNETMFLAGDATRLRTLGWAPRFALRDGLEDALRASV